MQLIFATGPSALARQHTARVIQLLQAAHYGLTCSECIATTTIELKEALLSGKAHAVVHSLKDLPVRSTPEIVVAAIPEREAAYDVLVSAGGQTLSILPEGARVGTSSLRRAAQLLACRPDLMILPLHGNIDTRLRKAMNREYDAIVLAQAGLTRLGLQSYISEVFSLDVMLPAPGQGALAVQCRVDDPGTLQLLAAIHNPLIAAAVNAERAFLASLGGGYSLPIGAFAEKKNGTIILTGGVVSADGKQAIRLSAADQDPHKLGERLAQLVLERGAAELLKARV